jgi:hypothetical protein
MDFRTASVPATVLGGVPASWRDLGSDGHYPDSRSEPQWVAAYLVLPSKSSTISSTPASPSPFSGFA